MNHPKPEEWLELLYPETENPAPKAEMEGHLRDCPECRERFETMRRTQAHLQNWKLPSSPLPKVNALTARFGLCPADLLRAAAMVAFLVGIGFLLGRHAVADNAHIQAELTAQIQGQFKEFAASEAAQRQEYQSALIKAIGHVEARRNLELARLRHDVETVAVHTQDELEDTQEGLYELAASEMSQQKSLNP